MSVLSHGEIIRVVSNYVGGASGYLADFSYRTHEEFYPQFCNLDINTRERPGTTRERFIAILLEASPRDQAKILRGTLERFPVARMPAPETRTEELREWILKLIDRLEGGLPVGSHTPVDASVIVERAIADAETLLRSSGASSGVDRVHTALHGFLIDVCKRADIEHAEDASLAALLKAIRTQHPAFQSDNVRRQEITSILRTMGSIADSLGPLRNSASLAHPKQVLDEPEAMLVINAARTMLHYVDARVRARGLHQGSPFP